MTKVESQFCYYISLLSILFVFFMYYDVWERILLIVYYKFFGYNTDSIKVLNVVFAFSCNVILFMSPE